MTTAGPKRVTHGPRSQSARLPHGRCCRPLMLLCVPRAGSLHCRLSNEQRENGWETRASQTTQEGVEEAPHIRATETEASVQPGVGPSSLQGQVRGRGPASSPHVLHGEEGTPCLCLSPSQVSKEKHEQAGRPRKDRAEALNRLTANSPWKMPNITRRQGNANPNHGEMPPHSPGR